MATYQPLDLDQQVTMNFTSSAFSAIPPSSSGRMGLNLALEPSSRSYVHTYLSSSLSNPPFPRTRRPESLMRIGPNGGLWQIQLIHRGIVQQHPGIQRHDGFFRGDQWIDVAFLVTTGDPQLIANSHSDSASALLAGNL